MRLGLGVGAMGQEECEQRLLEPQRPLSGGGGGGARVVRLLPVVARLDVVLVARDAVAFN